MQLRMTIGRGKTHWTTGAVLAVTITALMVLGGDGCGRRDVPAPPAATEPQLAGTTVEFIPFGEMNGTDVYNASGVISLADTRLLLCDNHTGDALFELNLTSDGRKEGPLIRRPLEGIAPGAIDDLEDMTLVEEGDRRYVFVTSSMNAKNKGGRTEIPPSGLLRVTLDPGERLRAENLPGLRDWLIAAYPELAAVANAEPDAGGINIEGLVWDHDRHALLLGVRTPVSSGKPLVLPVKVKDLAGPWDTSNLEALPPIELTVDTATGEVGVRGLAEDRTRDGFLVLVGKTTKGSDAPFALYAWDGTAKGETRRLDLSFAQKAKPEGVTRATIGGKSVLVFVDDAGGVGVIPDEVQELSRAPGVFRLTLESAPACTSPTGVRGGIIRSAVPNSMYPGHFLG